MEEQKKRPPHLEIELDALEHAADVARATGISEDTAIAGLVRMWRHCWRERVLAVPALAIRGFFATDVSEALQTFGFVGAANGSGSFPVRGAPRLLRINEARSRGGHAAKGHLIPGPKPKGGSRRAAEATSSAAAEGQPKGQPKKSFGYSSALQPPTTNHQPIKEAATAPKETATLLDLETLETGLLEFFAWAQETRRQPGNCPTALPEVPPPTLGEFWLKSAEVLGPKRTGLREAYSSFLEDDWARKLKPPCAFTAFASDGSSGWRRYIPGQEPPKARNPALGPAPRQVTDDEFAERQRLAALEYERLGPQHTNFGPCECWTCKPREGARYAG